MSNINGDTTSELRERLMRYRVLAQETTDPLASRFLRQIVAELEAGLEAALAPARDLRTAH
jgi:hypothetical protein